MKNFLKNKEADASKKIERLEIEVSILRDAYFQLERAIAERKKAEAALKESENKHRKLFEGANDMIQSISPEGVLVDVNPMWCRVMGYTKEEALKMNLVDLIHPRSKKHCMEMFKKVISGESVENIEAEFITKEGKVVIVNGNASCIFDNGKPSVTWGLFRDVTARKKTENALRKSEEKHRALTETSPDCIKLFDLKGNLLFINQGGLKEHGLKSLEEAISGKWKAIDTIVEEDQPEFKKAFEEAAKGKIITTEIKHSPEASNRENCLETLAPIKDDKGKVVGIFGVSRDITERKKAERILKESEEKYRTLTGNIPGMIYRAKPDWTTEVVSNSELVCGHSTKDLNSGRVIWSDIIYPDDKERVFNESSKITKKPLELKQEYRIIAKDGSIRWVEDKKVSLFEKGVFLGVDGVVFDISERKKAENKLKERMKELSIIYETSRIMEESTDLDKALYEILKVLPSAYQSPELACARITYNGKEYKTANFKETEWKQTAIIKAAGKELGAMEVFYLEKRPFLIEEERMIEEVAAQIGNITERKKAEKGLRKSAIYIDAMGEALMVLDMQRKVVKLNKAGLKLWGYTEKESLNLTFEDIVPKEEHGRQYALMQKAIKKEAVDPFETMIVTKEGKKIPVLLSGTILKGDSGKPVGFTGVFRDITERKKIEEKLRESEESLIGAQKIAHLGNWDWNIITNKLWWSDEIYRIFGLKPQEFGATYEAFLEAIHPEDRELVDKSVKEALKKNNYNIDHRIVLPSGEVRVVHEEAEVTYDKSGKPIRMVGVVHDITNLRKAQGQATQLAVEKARAKEAEAVAGELKKLDKMKDEFLDIASHELRTPLTAIRGNISLMQQYFSAKIEDKQLKEIISDIHVSSIRLIKLINDFLNVSRLEGGRIEFKKEEFNLSRLVQEVMDDLENTATQRGLYLRLEKIEGYLPNVLTDTERVRQVVVNLIGNAIKYTKKGGIAIKIERGDGFVKTKVIDTGIGIPEENQKLLFQKFQQAGERVLARDVTRGTGLGLYIAKMLTEEMGGKIYLESSELGKGSTFAFELPIANEKKLRKEVYG